MERANNMKSQSPLNAGRRQLLCATGTGISLLLGRSLLANEVSPEASRILQRGDQIDIDGRGTEILQRAYELGYAYEKKHGGCARCTVAALQDAIPFVGVDESLFRGSTCLDGGATPTGKQNCGAFTGAGMVLGYVCGSTRSQDFEGNAKLAHQLLHKVYDRFQEEYGTVLCEDVKRGANGDCPNVVGLAAQWTAEALLGEFADYAPPKQTDEKCQAGNQP
jgi:hypothetical protein